MDDMQESSDRRTDVGDSEDDYFQFVGDDPSDPGEVPMYTVLELNDVPQYQEEDINTVSAVLSIPKSWACTLLLHYQWSVSEIIEKWIYDEEQVKEEVGLTAIHPEGPGTYIDEHFCELCLENCPSEEMRDAGCGHLFCLSCWKAQLKSEAELPKCLKSKCPSLLCKAAVSKDMFLVLAEDDVKANYSHHFQSSYIENNMMRAWCPAADCVYAFEFIMGCKNSVLCKCGNYFCWKCSEEGHVPVSCTIAERWKQRQVQLDIADSQNLLWKLEHTKPCPKCNRLIQKNEGCQHMSCPYPCDNQFCWTCLQPWENHGGDFYRCIHYEEMEKRGAFNKTEEDKENLKAQHTRQVHHYRHWNSNVKLRQEAIDDLENLKQKYQLLSNIQKRQQSCLFKLLTEAFKEAAECRCLLKWSSVYGFFISEFPERKEEMLEYLKGQADRQLQKLESCARSIEPFWIDSSNKGSQTTYQELVKVTELATLRRVTKMCFRNLLQYLESGAAEFHGDHGNKESKPKSNEEASSSGTGGSSQS